MTLAERRKPVAASIPVHSNRLLYPIKENVEGARRDPHNRLRHARPSPFRRLEVDRTCGADA